MSYSFIHQTTSKLTQLCQSFVYMFSDKFATFLLLCPALNHSNSHFSDSFGWCQGLSLLCDSTGERFYQSIPLCYDPISHHTGQFTDSDNLSCNSSSRDSSSILFLLLSVMLDYPPRGFWTLLSSIEAIFNIHFFLLKHIEWIIFPDWTLTYKPRKKIQCF